MALPHLDHLYRTATWLCRDPDWAADLVQDTVVRAYRFWHQFEAGTNCKSWLLTILFNTFRNQYRGRKRNPDPVEFDDSLYRRDTGRTDEDVMDPANVVAATGLDDELKAALQALSPDFLEVVVLIDLQEMTYEETAAIIGRPVGTVRSRLARARGQLQANLAEYGRSRGLTK